MQLQISFMIFVFTFFCSSSAGSAHASSPASSDSIFQAGLRAYAEGRYEEAITWFDRAASDTITAPVVSYLGPSYGATNQVTQALCCFTAAVDEEPTNAGYQFHRAPALDSMNEYYVAHLGQGTSSWGTFDSCVTAYRQASRFDEDNSLIFLNAAVAWQRLDLTETPSMHSREQLAHAIRRKLPVRTTM